MRYVRYSIKYRGNGLNGLMEPTLFHYSVTQEGVNNDQVDVDNDQEDIDNDQVDVDNAKVGIDND